MMVSKTLNSLASSHLFYLMLPTFLLICPPLLTSFYFLLLQDICIFCFLHLTVPFPHCLPVFLLI